MVSLSARESGIVFKIMGELANDHDPTELRRQVGPLIMDLLKAQYLASYVWDENSSIFGNRIALNMSDDNLTSYEDYYQFHDPITPRLQQRRRTTSVNEVMSRRAFERSEFFNDFLKRDGLCFGINYYAYSGATNIGDLRIWRGFGREDFQSRDIEILDLIGPAFTNAMRLALARQADRDGPSGEIMMNAIERASRASGLTDREKQIAAALASGRTDQQIADLCFISVSTVRTHVKNIYRKFGVGSRTQLIHRITLQ